MREESGPAAVALTDSGFDEPAEAEHGGVTDPIRLQLGWSRAIAIVDEAAAVLMRAAVSPIIRESADLAVVVFDAAGRSVVQSTVCIPSFIGTLPATLRHFLAWRPAAAWRPGDVVVTNDPWIGTGQLNDLAMAMPIFAAGRLVGFVGVVAHLPDVGGVGGGNHATDTFEEGLHVPVCLLYAGGVPQPVVFDFIRENVRLPGDVESDIAAMKGAAEVCVTKTVTLLGELGYGSLELLSEEVRGRSRAAMRRAIGQLPDGRYGGEIALEGFGEDLVIRAALTVHADAIAVDFEGTSPQVDRAINSTLAHTFAHTAFALKCVLDPDIPGNDGALEPISVSAPPGSILNSRHPAAGRSRTQVSHYISSLLFSILADVVPDRVLGQPGSPRPVLTFRGEREDGRPFSSTYPVMAGMGAGAGFDGLSVMAFPTNTRVTPVEFMERTTPLLFLEKTLLPESGGRGRWRGGCGQKVRIAIEADCPLRVLTSPGRTRFAAKGVRGGGPGRPGSLTLNGADIAFAPHTITAHRGDVLEVHSAGGGGYEDEGSRR